jgi:hypothetical protein
VLVVDVVEEGGVHGAAGDGGVGVDDVEEVVDEVGVRGGLSAFRGNRDMYTRRRMG